MKQSGTLFVLVGPSRVGKDSVLRGLLRIKSLKLKKLVTATTRERRPGETAGKTYHYFTEEKFLYMIRSGRFLEWAPVRGQRFGTPKEPLLTWLKKGQNVLQQIDVRGADSLRLLKFLKVVTIFILPGSISELKHRLENNHSFTPVDRRIRWQETLHELSKQTEYDYRVVNEVGRLKQTIAEVAGIVRSISSRNI